MQPRIATLLLDAHHACQEIESFAHGRNDDEILDDRALQLILHKLIEIVGEALNQASKLDPSLKDTIPNLRRFVDVRNYFTHDYRSVDYSIVWQIATVYVPQLDEYLVELLKSDPDLPEDELATLAT
jgi:uncharacterized protein with HEPN domain